jgi:hypothetical protein
MAENIPYLQYHAMAVVQDRARTAGTVVEACPAYSSLDKLFLVLSE